MIRVENLQVELSKQTVLSGVDLEIENAKLSMIVGPNGCGKSTLLRSIAKLISSAKGKIILDKRDVKNIPIKQFSKMLGFLPQNPRSPQGLKVFDLVSRGRAPHQSFLRQWSDSDEAAVKSALEATAMTGNHNRLLSELSGGQKQRAWIAMILAQQTDIILLDEPTSALDLRYQFEIFQLLKTLTEDHGKTIVTVVHDLGIAARFADHIVALKEGRVVASGASKTVLTSENLQKIYDWPCAVMQWENYPLIIPLDNLETA